MMAVDKQTGEVLDGFPMYCQRKKHSSFSKEGFSFMSNSGMKMLAKGNLGEVALRLLLWIVSEMEMENNISLNQSQVAQEMGLDRSSINRALKKLIAERIVFEESKIGRSKNYRLNPHYGWKGSTTDHIKAIEKYEDSTNRSNQISNIIETDAVEVTTTVITSVKPKVSKGNSQN